MCRSTGEGGRRCPAAHNPSKVAARNQRRRETYAIQKALRASSSTTISRIFSAEDFEELLKNVPQNVPGARNERNSNSSGNLLLSSELTLRQVRRELTTLITQDDVFQEPGSPIRDVHVAVQESGYLQITVEGDDDSFEMAYINLNNGFMFFGDDPENGMRDDLTFPVTFGTFEKAETAADLYGQVKSLVRKHRAQTDWESDIPSMRFAYKTFGHFGINQQLRDGVELSPQLRTTFDGLCSDVLEKDTVVYRGIQCSNEERTRILEEVRTSGTISDKGLMSTSLTPHISKSFAGAGGLVVAIPLKKGQKCWNASTEDNEEEVLLPMGQVFDDVRVYELS